MRAAMRAIFLSSKQYCAGLPLIEHYGLTHVLNRRNPEGELINQALAVRLAALCAFYLSDDYVELRTALIGK